LLEANAEPLAAFAEALPREKSPADWIWLVPDAESFTERLDRERQEYWWDQILRQVQESVEPEPLAGKPPLDGGRRHPGEVLEAELDRRGITPYRLAHSIGLDQVGIARI